MFSPRSQWMLAAGLAAVVLVLPTRAAEPGKKPKAETPAQKANAAEPLAPMAAQLAVKPAGPLLANFPVELTLSITPEGPTPIFYSSGRYPPGELFSVEITDAAGQTRTVTPTNGLSLFGFGRIRRPVEAGKGFPVVIDPLPVGRYTLQVRSEIRKVVDQGADKGKTFTIWPAMETKPIEVEVKEDAVAVAAGEKELQKRIASEPFAQHVAQTYGIDPVVAEWMDLLLKANSRTDLLGLGRLSLVRRLPPGRDADLVHAAENQTRTATPNAEVLDYIARLAGNLKTDAALEALEVIVRARVNQRTAETAIVMLSSFPQKKRVDEVLLEVVAQKKHPAYLQAVGLLGRHRHPAAIGPLLYLAKDGAESVRAGARQQLSDFSHDPAAREVLETALQAPEPDVREFAQRALQEQDKGR